MNFYNTLITTLKTIPPKELEKEYISKITDTTITIVGEDSQTITFEFDENGKLIFWR